jgi:hypothetical protein
MAVTMKNTVFWDVTPCGYCKNHARGTQRNIPEDGILQCSFVCLRMAMTGFDSRQVHTGCDPLCILSIGHPDATSRAVKWTERGANHVPSSDFDVNGVYLTLPSLSQRDLIWCGVLRSWCSWFLQCKTRLW